MRYNVKSPISHGNHQSDQRRYEPGEIIELSEADATPLLKVGAIELHQPKTIELVINPMFDKGA